MVDMTALALSKLDPVRQFDWRIVIPELQEIELCIVSGALPNITVEEIEMSHYNAKTRFAGKGDADQMNLSCKDIIQFATAMVIYEWHTKVYDPETGEIGYSSEYKKDGDLYTLDTYGKTVATWRLHNIWPTSVNYGTVDHTASDMVQIEVTLRYDSPILLSYNKTAP